MKGFSLARWLGRCISAAGAMAPVSALAQQLGRGDDTAISLWRVLIGVVLILTLGGTALYLGRGRMKGIVLWQKDSDRRLKVIETARMAPNTWLCLASCDGKECLLAITAHSVTLVNGSALGESQ